MAGESHGLIFQMKRKRSWQTLQTGLATRDQSPSATGLYVCLPPCHERSSYRLLIFLSPSPSPFNAHVPISPGPPSPSPVSAPLPLPHHPAPRGLPSFISPTPLSCPHPHHSPSISASFQLCSPLSDTSLSTTAPYLLIPSPTRTVIFCLLDRDPQ